MKYFIRTQDPIGDAILQLPTLELIAQHDSSAEFIVATPKLNHAIFERLPYRVSLLDAKPKHNKNIGAVLNYLRSILGTRADFGLIYKRNLFEVVVARFFCKKLLCYKTDGASIFANHSIKRDKEMHSINRSIALPASYWKWSNIDIPRVPIPYASSSMINQADENIVIYLGNADRPMRNYSDTQTSRLLHLLVSKRPETRYTFIGASNESERADALALELVKLGGKGQSLAGKTSISELIDLIGSADALLTIDSSPLHIASSTDTPYVAIVGRSESGYENQIPKHGRGISLMAVGKQIFDNQFTKEIAPEDIVNALELVMDSETTLPSSIVRAPT